MNQQREAVLEEVYALIDKYKDALVLVEGKKDKEALKALGFNRVVTINTSKPLYKVAEEVKDKRVLLLTDLDKKGKQIYSRLKKDLNKQGVLVDDKLRTLLFKTELRQIEGLTTYLDKFSKK